jgi:pimeloyl-ACP methyl ester carboxylesterase
MEPERGGRRIWLDPVPIPAGAAVVEGSLDMPLGARGLVLFAHGSGSSRFSPRNRFVAGRLREAELGTLLVDLLTEAEDADPEKRFDIDFLTDRLERVTAWFRDTFPDTPLPIGYFGASTGAAAALRAAAELGPAIGAIVSRGGRPDLAWDVLPRVQTPTLFIVGSEDHPVLEWNHQAYDRLTSRKKLAIVPGATHLFEEPGALEEVAREAASWFECHLSGAKTR